jgi:hypothetical protein
MANHFCQLAPSEIFPPYSSVSINRYRDLKMANDTNQFPPIEQETRSHVEAQTLRYWACAESGPLRPVRIMGRLAWPVDTIKRILKCGASAGSTGDVA